MTNKELLKSILDWTTPPKIQPIILNLYNKIQIKKYSDNRKNFELIKNNKPFKNFHHGKRCFVIGNGPSINKQDLTLLKNEITFVANGFCKNNIVNHWQPTYYLFADPIYFDNSEVMNNFFSELNLKIHDSRFFIPQNFKEMVQKYNILPEKRTFFFNMKDPLTNETIIFPDLTSDIPSVLNVAQLEILVAMYMGCNPIYLMGLDHDWLSYPPDMKNDRTFQHFYSDQKIDNYYKKKTNSIFEYKSIMKDMLQLWKGYENLSKLSRENNIEIINVTEGGFLDVFSRVKYDDLF